MKIKRLIAGCARFLAVFTLSLLSVLPAWSGSIYRVVHAFGSGNDGGGLWSSVTLDKQGNLYGSTSGGGLYAYGVVFKLTRHQKGTWTETILHNFKNGDPDGSEPNGGLIQDALGNWYGTTDRDGAYHGGTAFQVTHGADGWTDNVIYPFGEQSDDGGSPTAGLIMDTAGNLFGTTPKGNGSNGGTTFQLTRSSGGWNETVIYQFCLSNPTCVDGNAPYAGLILDPAGNLYGTTEWGGTGCVAEGCGTVYEIQRSSGGWKQIVLHRFDNNGRDGVTPGNGALLMDSAGRIYGTTEVGGTFGWGTLFRLTRVADGSWKETILRNFKNDASGSFPASGVVMDKAGNLYGTTTSGGTQCGCGVVYKLAPGPKGKWTYTLLHTFTGADGAQPDANLILDDKGNLYGTTATGGTYGGGVVFEITP